MALKVGLNKQEQKNCAKWLDGGIHPDDIAKKLSTTTDVVKKFTTTALAEAKKAKKSREEAAKLAQKKREEKAKLLNSALDSGEFK